MGLIGFDLKEIIAALGHDRLRPFALARQGIGGDALAIQGRQAFQQGGRDCWFASCRAILRVINGDGLGRSVLVLGQGEPPDLVPNHFTVQRQRLRQLARLAAKPSAEQRGKGFGVHARKHLVEHVIPRHLMEVAGSFLQRQAQRVALALRQGGGKAGNLAPASHACRVGRPF